MSRSAHTTISVNANRSRRPDANTRAELAADQRLVDDHLELATSLAARYRYRGIDYDDLIQVARLGLVAAARRYRPERGNFQAFAGATIRGELKKYFRDRAWSVRPPRRIQDLKSELFETRNRLSKTDESDLARQHHVSRHDVSEALTASTCYRTDSLDVPPARGHAPRWEQLPDGTDDYVTADRRMDLKRVLALLSRDDQVLIGMRFVEELTQQEIADRTHTSQMQVSRKLARVIDQLRSALITNAA